MNFGGSALEVPKGTTQRERHCRLPSPQNTNPDAAVQAHDTTSPHRAATTRRGGDAASSESESGAPSAVARACLRGHSATDTETRRHHSSAQKQCSDREYDA